MESRNRTSGRYSCYWRALVSRQFRKKNIATLNNADIVASWNFKHIVNISRIRGYNGVNYKLGHKVLEIRTPREILEV